MLVLFQEWNAFSADSTAAFISSEVLWGTLVTSLLVAGSFKSIHCDVAEATNSLFRKFVMFFGFSMGSWERWYPRSTLGVLSTVVACIVLVMLNGFRDEFNLWIDDRLGEFVVLNVCFER